MQYPATMAADFSTASAVAPQQQQPYHHHAYKTSGQYSPMHSGANTPTNVSPTSPRTLINPPPLQTHHVPHIRPLKTPIYVPAALRKTEKRTRNSPPKVDSAVDSGESSWTSNFRRPAESTFDSTISRTVTEEELNNDAPLSPVAGPIAKFHWKADDSTNVCSASMCGTPFTFLNRRHHCRRCGGIFCYQHSNERAPLDEKAHFHPQGPLFRVCDRCFGDYQFWQQHRSSRTNSESSASARAVDIETPTIATPAPTPAKRPEATRVGSLATSFQGAWNWSTF